MAILHFLAAGVRIDVDCPDDATADLISNAGANLLAPAFDPTGDEPGRAPDVVPGVVPDSLTAPTNPEGLTC